MLKLNKRDIKAEIDDFVKIKGQTPKSITLNESSYKSLPKSIQETMLFPYKNKFIKIIVCKDCKHI